MADLVTSLFSGLGGAIIGAIAGGMTVSRSVDKKHRLDLELQEQNEQSIVKGLLQSIHDEIDTVWNMYNDKAGVILEALRDNSPFLTYFPVIQDYFTVYHNNSTFIGKIKDSDLRKAIVTTYTKAKGLVDSYRMNNEFIRKYEYFSHLFAESRNQAHSMSADVQLQLMTDYAKKIKASHNELKREVQELLRMLHKQGVLYDEKGKKND